MDTSVRRVIPLTAGLLCLLAACSTMENTWEGTKAAYQASVDVINPDPEIDLDNYHFDNPNAEKLARLFTPVDEPLTMLMRYMEDQDVFPDEDWMRILLRKFPWVDGVLVADTEGTILVRIPPIPVKRFSQPLRFEAVWRETFIKPVVDYPELGPELYLGTPIFKDVEFTGLIVSGFDPRVILSFSPNPAELVLIHPGGGVWSGDPDVDEEGLLGVDWVELMRHDDQGQVQVNGEYYTWLGRYIGQDRFVYATKSVDPENPPGSSWWPL